MASLGNVSKLFTDLSSEFKKSKPDLKKCGNLLDQLKVNKRFEIILVTFQLFSYPTDWLVKYLLLAYRRASFEGGTEDCTRGSRDWSRTQRSDSEHRSI